MKVSKLNGCSDCDFAQVLSIANSSDYAKRMGGQWLATKHEVSGIIQIVQGVSLNRLVGNRQAIAIVQF